MIGCYPTLCRNEPWIGPRERAFQWFGVCDLERGTETPWKFLFKAVVVFPLSFCSRRTHLASSFRLHIVVPRPSFRIFSMGNHKTYMSRRRSVEVTTAQNTMAQGNVRRCPITTTTVCLSNKVNEAMTKQSLYTMLGPHDVLLGRGTYYFRL